VANKLASVLAQTMADMDWLTDNVLIWFLDTERLRFSHQVLLLNGSPFASSPT
jgi:hypothetical protein